MIMFPCVKHSLQTEKPTPLIIHQTTAFQEVERGCPGGFVFKREMHTFMPAVLLRMTRFDALDVNPQGQPSH